MIKNTFLSLSNTVSSELGLTFALFFSFYRFLAKSMGSFFCPISILWKQQSYNYIGRVKRWQVSTKVPLCSSARLILPGTKERTSTNAASLLYGWIYEATRVETPQKCRPQTTTQECSQISFSKEDTERSAS